MERLMEARSNALNENVRGKDSKGMYCVKVVK